jgi:putative transposase
LVFLPKYRRAVINERVFSLLEMAGKQVCTDFELELREAGWETGHVHLLVAYLPKVSLSKPNLPEVGSKLWGEYFWSPSYCAVPYGGAPLDTIKRNIQAQRGGASSPT